MGILDNYKNLALAQIATPPAPPASGTSLTLAAGQGAYLPTPPFNATVFGGASFPSPTTAEIIRVTAMVGDVATIVRQQENTAARTILPNDYVAATFTTKFITDLTDSANQVAGLLPDARLSANVARRDQNNVFQGDLSEKGRTTPIGHWIPVPYSAANFTASSGAWTVQAADVTDYSYTLVGKTMWLTFSLSSTTVGAPAPTELRIALPGGFTARTSQFLPALTFYDGNKWGAGFLVTAPGGAYIGCRKDPAGAGTWTTATPDGTRVFGTLCLPLA